MVDAHAGSVLPTADSAGRDVSDRQLLERFVSRRDEAAFAALVKRHGGAVWGVCRRVLRQAQDADDAFQAVFLVLARKAGSIRKREAVGSWLYGVAYRISARARLAAARRRRREKQLPAAAPQPQPCGEASFRELQLLLDEEVQRLAARYRVPFVLCCLEGMSRAEAARELGWKEGTLSGRLARARSLLQRRLARRGLTLTAVLTAAALAPTTGAAAAPPALVHAAVQAALAPAGSQAVALSPPAALAQNLLHGMAVAAKTKAAGSLLLGLAVLAAGVRLASNLPGGGPAPAADRDVRQKAANVAGEVATFLTPPFRLVPPARVAGPPAGAAPETAPPAGSRVRALAYAPDGKVVAVATADRAAQIRDAQTGAALRVLPPQPMAITCLAFSPDGKTLAGGSFDKTVKLWDPATGKERRTLAGHAGAVHALAFTPDGKKLASAGAGRTVKVWDVGSGKVLAAFEGPAIAVRALAVAPGGRSLAGGGDDGTIVVWDLAGAAAPVTFRGHEAVVRALAYSPDGLTLASAGDDRTVKLWEPSGGPARRTLTGHGDQVWVLAYSPDGRTLVSGGRDMTVRVWDPAGGEARQVLTRHRGAVTGLAFHPRGKHLLSASYGDALVLRWEVAPPSVPLTLTGDPAGNRFAVFSPAGDRLASGGEGGTVTLWRRSLAPAQASFLNLRWSFWDVAFSPDGRTVALASDTTVQVRGAVFGQLLGTLPVGQPVRSVAFSPDGKYLAAGTGSWDDLNRPSYTRLFDAATRQELATLDGHTGMTYCVRFAPDGKVLATTGNDNTIRLWDVPSGKLKDILRGHAVPAGGMAFLPDGTLATASWDGTVRFWDLGRGAERKVWKVGVPLASLDVSPDGRYLAAAEGTDGAGAALLKVWEVGTGRETALHGHAGRILGLVFTRDGRGLLAAGGRLKAFGEIAYWDLAAGRLRASHRTPGQWIANLAVSVDGKRVLSASDGLRCWDLDFVEKERSWSAHRGAVTCGCFTADGSVLITGGAAGDVRLWSAATGESSASLGERGKPVRALALLPDGKGLLVAGGGPAVERWDAATFAEKAALRGHALPVSSVAVSPDGRTLASGGADPGRQDAGELILWDLEGGGPRKRIGDADKPVRSVACSPDGKWVAAGGADGWARVYDAGTGLPRVTLSSPGAGPLAFSPDGTVLAAAKGTGFEVGSDGDDVSLWQTASWHRLGGLQGHKQPVQGVAFSPDGRTLASASRDGTIKLWPVPGAADKGGAGAAVHGQVAIGEVGMPEGEVPGTPGGTDTPADDREPVSPAAADPSSPKGASKHSLAIVEVLALVLSLAACGVWLRARRRRWARDMPGQGQPRGGAPPPGRAAAPLSVACPGCGKSLKAPAELAGKKARCPRCGQAVPVGKSNA